MDKKLMVGFIAVFIGMVLTDFLIHGLILSGAYHSADMANLMRPDADAKVWIHIVTAFIKSFFFVLIFSKGYRGTGMAEGVRYGFYMGMIFTMGMAYDTYAAFQIHYSLALHWFFLGVIQWILLGILASMVYGKSAGTPGGT
jgi:hypothetical protein